MDAFHFVSFISVSVTYDFLTDGSAITRSETDLSPHYPTIYSLNHCFLGFVDENHDYEVPSDNMPYLSLMYANGPGYVSPRQNLTNVDTEG